MINIHAIVDLVVKFNNGRKVESIYDIRRIFDVGLREAKEMFEDLLMMEPDFYTALRPHRRDPGRQEGLPGADAQ
jgi:hypothetical protein